MLTHEQVEALIRYVAEERRGGSDLAVEYQADGLYLWVGGTRVEGDRTGGSRGDGAGAPRLERAAAAPPSVVPPPAAAEQPVAEEERAPEGHVLGSPIVGTFYVAPSPDSPPYVEEGSRVEKGQVVCIVEAMKLMNEIEADVSGVVTSVVPANGDPVEFGAPLFVIRIE